MVLTQPYPVSFLCYGKHFLKFSAKLFHNFLNYFELKQTIITRNYTHLLVWGGGGDTLSSLNLKTANEEARYMYTDFDTSFSNPCLLGYC